MAARARPPAMAALAVAALVAGLAAQLALPGPDPLEPLAAAAPRRVPPEPARFVPPLDQYPSLVRRTLFAPSRAFARAPVAGSAATAAAPAADPFLAVRLLGTARARNFTSAVIRDASGRAATLRLGDRVAGWRLVRIGRDAVLFAQGGARRTLVVGAAAASAEAVDMTDFATGEEQ